MLVAGDFPRGWTSTPPEPPTEENEAASVELAECVGTSGDDAKSAEVEGDEFKMGNNLEVNSEASIVEDEDDYRRDVSAIKGPKLQPCVRDIFTTRLAEALGTPLTSAEIESLEVPTHGDVTVGLRMTVGLTAEGQPLTLFMDVVLMGRDRAEVTATFISVNQPFDKALQTSLIDALGERLEAA